MDPSTALEKQLEVYRRMTGEERLAIALRLHELTCDPPASALAINTPKPRTKRSNRS